MCAFSHVEIYSKDKGEVKEGIFREAEGRNGEDKKPDGRNQSMNVYTCGDVTVNALHLCG